MNTPASRLPSRPRIVVLASAFALAFTFAGCASSPKVEPIIRATPAQTFSYHILPSDGTESAPGALRYEEAAAAVARALNRRGMKPANPNQTPEVVIAIDYSVSPPQPAEKIYRAPIIKRVYQSAPKIQANGANVQLGAHNADTQLMKPPDLETVGYETKRMPVLVHDKRLLVIGRAASGSALGNPGEELWTIDVTSEGVSGDLRPFLTAMSAAGLNHIDRETRGKVLIRLSDTNEVGNIIR
ncbi:MAG TPA: hypothetical protein VGD88_15520 [Opitutaceae bacterium]